MAKNKFEMSQYLACSAKNRPEYCQYDTNVCCFSCDLNEECTKHALVESIMKPCGEYIFEPTEICEFAL